MSNKSGIRVSKISLVALVLVTLALPAAAQLASPVNPTPTNYNGTCQITGVTASNPLLYTGKYANYGAVNFSCSGTFYGKITARLFLEDMNRPVCSPSGGCGFAVFAQKSKEWPIMGTKCSTYFGMTQCIPYTVEASPSSSSLSISTQTYASKITARGIVEWVTGPCSTFLGVTTCPTQKVTATATTP